MPNIFDTDLPKTPANYVPLSPLSLLAHAATVHPDRPAIVHGAIRRTWSETYARCRRLASALAARGIRRGDTVAIMAPNTPELFEAHYGIPMLGAVLCAINTRADAATVAYILEHGEAKILLVDADYREVAAASVQTIDPVRRPSVIDVSDNYETLLAGGDPDFAWSLPPDEWDAIALNYTSGTTGRPKGVVYHHRGAYLAAIGNVVAWQITGHPVYLWTLPMFHCNGWTFPWAMAVVAGTNVCLRRVEAGAILAAIAAEGVTHLCGAPIVMGMILNAPDATTQAPRVRMMTAGAAPPAAVIEGMTKLGFDVTHTYGLTEVYGPITICEWKEEWDALPVHERAAIRARQGVPYAVQEGMMVSDPEGRAVPRDGATLGELLLRGNATMKGYLKNAAATELAFAGGWFHADGYAEIRDRAKDIIISGGENISSIEVENALYFHPAVLEAAVVARPDPTWGETPCAFVTLKPEAEATEAELIAFVRDRIAHYKAPKTVVFGPLPKTATGKMQKFVLRERAKSL